MSAHNRQDAQEVFASDILAISETLAALVGKNLLLPWERSGPLMKEAHSQGHMKTYSKSRYKVELLPNCTSTKHEPLRNPRSAWVPPGVRLRLQPSSGTCSDGLVVCRLMIMRGLCLAIMEFLIPLYGSNDRLNLRYFSSQRAPELIATVENM